MLNKHVVILSLFSIINFNTYSSAYKAHQKHSANILEITYPKKYNSLIALGLTEIAEKYSDLLITRQGSRPRLTAAELHEINNMIKKAKSKQTRR